MKTKITIKEVKQIKTGNSPKTGKEWTLWSITGSDGKRYGSFNGKYNTMVGQEIEIEYTSTEQNGKTFYNIVEPKNTGLVDTPARERIKQLEANLIAQSKKITALEEYCRWLMANYHKLRPQAKIFSVLDVESFLEGERLNNEDQPNLTQTYDEANAELQSSKATNQDLPF